VGRRADPIFENVECLLNLVSRDFSPARARFSTAGRARGEDGYIELVLMR
jgi:hypothetical protein